MKIQGGNVKLLGEIKIPGDKSISHRAVMIGSLAEGKTTIKNFLMGEDCLSTIECFKNMGVKITVDKEKVEIGGVGLNGLHKPNKTLDVGNSGTTMRLLSGILAGQNFTTTISGDDSIQRRPMDRIIKPLELMGANIEGIDNKYAPLEIKPTISLKGIKYSQPIPSAQVKSCVLLAGLYANGITQVVQPEFSRDHTERMLKYFGYDIKVEDKNVILKHSNKITGKSIIVPGDISSAAYIIVGALILKNSKVLIKEVGLNETRNGIIDVLKAMGGNIKILNYGVVNNEPMGDILVEYSKLEGQIIQGDIIPRLIDEIPILAVASAVAEGTTIIRNAEELKVKESNRIKSIVNELKKMNVDIEETNDGMIIKGPNEIIPAKLETYNDHRIAMALSILSLYVQGESQLNETDSVNISFPDFFEALNELKR